MQDRRAIIGHPAEEPSGPSLARRFAREAARIDLVAFEDAPARRLKLCLLDFVGCACEAFDLPASRQARAIAPMTTEGAPVIGSGRLAPPGDAAFANGVAGHGLVREDMHPGSIAHLGVVVWPVLLALSAARPVSGAAFLKAGLCGYEVGAKLGRALFEGGLARLYRPTGVVGPPAGALAGAVLLGLDESRTVAALALAANCSSGLNEWPATGASDMYFHPGHAARAAVSAVLLAACGADGAEAALDGPAGLIAAFRRSPPPSPIRLFEGPPEILAVYCKPAPACNFAQTACQAAAELSTRVGDHEAISELVVRLPEAAIRYPGCDHAGPFERALQAKMSIQFSVAAAMRRGRIEEANYLRLDDPSILRLARLVRLERDEGLTQAFPGRQGAEIAVALTDGGRIRYRLDDVRPASEDEIRARFREAAAIRLGAQAAREIESLVDGCESLADAGEIGRRCRLAFGEPETPQRKDLRS
jgi:2-methylcitrate dehydratase PrpD